MFYNYCAYLAQYNNDNMFDTLVTYVVIIRQNKMNTLTLDGVQLFATEDTECQ